MVSKMTSTLYPRRGEVWLADLNPTRGHEQAGIRPVVVVSAERFHGGPSGLAVISPMTTQERRLPWLVSVEPPEGGVRQRSFVLCQHVRTIDRRRLMERWGSLQRSTMAAIEDRLRILMEL